MGYFSFSDAWDWPTTPAKTRQFDLWWEPAIDTGVDTMSEGPTHRPRLGAKPLYPVKRRASPQAEL